MHELSLINDLLNKIRRLALQNAPAKLVAVNVELGALAHISAEHFREHFQQATRETELQDIQLNVATADDIHSPTAQDILLKSIAVNEESAP